jgi:hypothetical protein
VANQLLTIGLFHKGLQDMTVIREGVGHGGLRIMEAPNAVNFMKMWLLGCFHPRLTSHDKVTVCLILNP